jgi:hypothetical protein
MQLWMQNLLHLLRAFDYYSRKYGPIFRLQMGKELMVVISDPSIVREAFQKVCPVIRGPFLLAATRY